MSAAYCLAAPEHPVHASYHAREYGFPSRDESVLFERLVLEINQAGLSWLTILKKRAAFRAAFANFDVDAVAAFGPVEIERLLNDAGIIRNRLKIQAAIGNAIRVQRLRDVHGGFAAWLDSHHPRSKDEWVRLFRKNFLFTGGEITGEFLMSLGYLSGAHEPSCPIYAETIRAHPPWRNEMMIE